MRIWAVPAPADSAIDQWVFSELLLKYIFKDFVADLSIIFYLPSSPFLGCFQDTFQSLTDLCLEIFWEMLMYSCIALRHLRATPIHLCCDVFEPVAQCLITHPSRKDGCVSKCLARSQCRYSVPTDTEVTQVQRPFHYRYF